MRRLLTGLLALALLAGACGDDDGDDRAAVTSIPDDPPTTSSTTTEPPVPPIDVIPQDVSLITEEYVERVLDALYEVSLEAVQLARHEGVVDQPSIRLLEATSSEELALSRINGLIEDASTGFADYPDRLRAVDATVVDVIVATASCIFAEATFDSSGMSSQPSNSEGFTVFARLFAATEEQRSTGLNPTAWVLDSLPATDDGAPPDETCP